MNRFLKQTVAHPFFSSSFILLIGTTGINGINYLYHLIMGRLLGPAMYGELSVLFSLIGLLSIVPLAFGTVIIKFIASAANKEEVGGYIHWFNRPVYYVAIGLSTGVIASSWWLKDYLNVSSFWLIGIIGISFLFGLPASFNRAVLQGLIKFKLVVISVVTETSVKLIAGVIFVWLGFGVGGAMMGLLFSIVVGFISSYYFIRSYAERGIRVPSHLKKVISFSIPVLIQSVAGTSLISMDLVLVKHFFTPFDAGIYAAVATLGKILMFATAPIASVMFPTIASYKAQGRRFFPLFLIALLMTLLASSAILLVYLFLPELVLNILYGSKYLAGTYLVVPYAIFMALISLNSLFINFYLSIDKKLSVIFGLIAAIVQIIGISFWHQNLLQVIWVSVGISALLLVSLSVYLVTITNLHEKFFNKK